MTFDKSRACHQLDGKQGAFSGHARDRQNPVDLARLAGVVPVPLVPQDEPS
jgi:hypothetical protein